MKILIYSNPRSGTNLIRDCLGVMHGNPHFILKTHDLDMSDNNQIVIYNEDWGAKLRNDVQCECPLETLFIVHLFRANKLRQAISLVKAVQSDIWFAHEDTLPYDNYVYDAEQIAYEMKRFICADAYQFRWLSDNGVPHMQVCYETFSESQQSMEVVCCDILERTGLPILRETLPSVPLTRQFDEISQEWELRFLMETCGDDFRQSHLS